MADTKLLTLSEIFNNIFLRIPDFQRGYSWGEKELTEFWEDVLNLKDNQYHYCGLLTVERILLEKAKKLKKFSDDLWLFDKGLKAFYIIDGQQRITTIIILLKTILDKYKDTESINYESKANYISKYLYQISGNYKSYIFGYEKDDPSNEFFKTEILNQISSLSTTVERNTIYTYNLKFAKTFFENKIKKIKGESLESLFKKVVLSLKFNFYEIDKDLDVYVTFETMNNRGKDLSKLELLKNRLIYLTTIEQNEESKYLRDDINNAWRTIYHYLGKNQNNVLDDDEFLYNHWIMYFKFTKAESDAYSKFLLREYFTAKNLRTKKITYSDIKGFTDSIRISAEHWYCLNNPEDFNFTPNVKEYYNKVKRLNFGPFRPILLALLSLKIEDENQILKLLKSIERFLFLVFRVAGRQSNTQSNNFFRLANDFYLGEIKIYDLIDEIQKLIDGEDEEGYYGWFDIERFKENIKDLYSKANGFYSWGGLKYFLFEYELSLKKQNSNGPNKVLWKDITNETIEHIYPKEATLPCWKESFNSYSKKNKEVLLNSLGNLLLLSKEKNSKFQHSCFEDKKKDKEIGYFKGSYSEIEVSANKFWTPLLILNRSLQLVEFLEKRWNIKLGTNKEKKDLLMLDFLS